MVVYNNWNNLEFIPGAMIEVRGNLHILPGSVFVAGVLAVSKRKSPIKVFYYFCGCGFCYYAEF